MIHISFHINPRARLSVLRAFLVTIGLFLLLPFLLVGWSSVFAAVVINEVFPKPDNETEEWIELYNNGPDPVSLSGWRIENTAGDKKTYTFPSDFAIGAHGLWTFDQLQTDISLYNEGDTVRLFDASNNQVDSQSYPSILGYNTSVGRSSDGGGVWTICASWTKNLPNNCPLPTPTPTPIPTPVPTNTPIPTPTRVPTVTRAPTLSPTQSSTSKIEIVSPLAQSDVLGETSELTPPPANKPSITTEDFMQSKVHKLFGVASICIAVLMLLTLIVRLYRRYKHRHAHLRDGLQK